MNDTALEDLKEWASHPCTLYHVKKLQEVREAERDKLSSNFFRDDDYATQRSIGICQSLLATIESIESLKEKEEEAQDDQK